MTKSKKSLWDKNYEGRTDRHMYADPLTATMAANWLNHSSISVVEDWGCGFGGFAEYLNEDKKYVGVDGSNTIFAAKIEDLVEYKTKVDAIHLRHVLEHNQEWKKIFHNFLQSFTKRAVLTLFTPFVNEAKIIKSHPNWNNTGEDMVDISLSFDELLQIIGEYKDIKVSYELDLKTKSQYGTEHIFYLERIN